MFTRYRKRTIVGVTVQMFAQVSYDCTKCM